MSSIQPYVVSPGATIRDAMTCIDKNGKGISLVVDAGVRLLASVTDGDIRRALLNGVDLDLPLQSLIDERNRTKARGPLTAPDGTSDSELLRLMHEHDIRQIPIVTEDRRVVDMAFLSDLARDHNPVCDHEMPLTAVIMVGGFGTRLRPLTDSVPKPMLPVGDRPMLEWTIEQLKKTGIHRINLTTHYKPEVISDHFGNGDDFGVEITYVHEDEPLGTAGSLGLLDKVAGPLLVINGDILTNVDFRAMLAHHRKHNACLTVGVRRYEFQVPYGVVECNGEKVAQVSEKPRLCFLVNAGMYLLEPSALEYIPGGQTFDMPDLIQQLIKDNREVVSFPIVEYWLDIGKPDDYETAQQDVRDGRISIACAS